MGGAGCRVCANSNHGDERQLLVRENRLVVVVVLSVVTMSRKELDLLGAQRESMYINPLLMASEVGKPRRRGFTLPNATFTYGMRSECKDGGASEAMSNWNTHRPTGSPGNKKVLERDFIALNKAAVGNGLTTAHEQAQYRATHDIRRRDDSLASRKGNLKFNNDMVYGITTRPSTPIYELLEHRYQDAWIQERKEAERKQREKIIKKKLHGKVYETRASLMRRYSEPVDAPPLWKMSQWASIEPQLKTFRSEKERSTAFHQHASDSTARTGLFGHGIYQAAKC